MRSWDEIALNIRAGLRKKRIREESDDLRGDQPEQSEDLRGESLIEKRKTVGTERLCEERGSGRMADVKRGQN